MKEEDAIEELSRRILDATRTLLTDIDRNKEQFIHDANKLLFASLYALVLSSNDLRRLTKQLLSSSETLEKFTRKLNTLTIVLIILTILTLLSIIYQIAWR